MSAGGSVSAGEPVGPARGVKGRRMTRAEFDRRASRFAWPRGDYDARRGLAEVVAEPMLGRDSRARLAYDLVRAVCGDRAYGAGALRIEWRGSVLEPDESFYFFDPGVELGFGFDEACCPERGHRPPPLVVEIDRSSPPARAAEKRGDYFDSGVREVWAWTPAGGAAIHRRRPGAEAESVPASEVVPGVHREDLEELWAAADWVAQGERRSSVARRVLARLAGRPAPEAAP